jgi:hypothetical protein
MGGAHVVGAGNGVKAANAAFANAGLFALHTAWQNRETVSMKKLPTGEPYAGKPPVRFGGRGRRKPIPTPIMTTARGNKR